VTGRLAKILTPPPRLNCREWADQFRVLSKESSAMSGRYRSSNAPYQREPMEAVTDPEVQSVALMLASQLGKTEMVNNMVGYFIDADPSPILVVQPTIERAEEWSKERLSPMIRDTPCLTDKVKSPRSRDSGNTILTKSFPGGNIAVAGANAPSGLAARPRRVVIMDEVDRFPFSAGTEGDPCALAERRTESFWNAVIVKTSTPTIKHVSRIEKEMDQSDQRRWFCKCPKCGVWNWLKWSQVQWPKDQPEEARYVCESCQAALTDEDRIAMVMGGEWRATGKKSARRGYYLNGINSLFRHKKGFRNRLHQMAEEHIQAVRKGRETIKTWVNTFLAETFEEQADKVETNDMLKKRESYTQIPNGVLLLTSGVDVQGDRLEVEIVGWGEGEESWGIQYVVIPGSPFDPQTWEKLDELLTSEWKRADGVALKIKSALVDTGGTQGNTSWQPQVLRFTKPRFGRGIMACKGSSTPGAPVIAKISRANAKRAAVMMVGTSSAKDIIMHRMKMTEFGPGYMHFTDDPKSGFGEVFFQMLTAEEARLSYVNGVARRKWTPKVEGARNEALDCRVYAYAALQWLAPKWEKVKAGLAKTSQHLTMVPVEQPKQEAVAANPDQAIDAAPKPRPARQRIPGRSWMGGFKRY